MLEVYILRPPYPKAGVTWGCLIRVVYELGLGGFVTKSNKARAGIWELRI